MANIDDKAVDLFFKVVQYLTIPVVSFVSWFMRLAIKDLAKRFDKFDNVHKDLYDRLNDTDKELNRLVGICEARNSNIDRRKEKR